MRLAFNPYSQRIPLKSGDEFDAFTTWRRKVYWHTHERSRIERTYHKRWRRQLREFLKFLSQPIDTD